MLPNTGRLDVIECDYGDVLVYKALLQAVKAQIQAKDAYDLFTNTDDQIVEQVYGKTFKMVDFLQRYPDILKVLPTSHSVENGKAALLQSKQDLIGSLDAFLTAINYIRNEASTGDLQEDELFFFDPNDYAVVDELKSSLVKLKNSLIGDYVETYQISTTKSYSLHTSESLVGQLQINYGPGQVPQTATLELEQCAGPYLRLVSDTIDIDKATGYIDMELETETPSKKYTYSRNLENADSVRFTPIGCTGSPNYRVEYLTGSSFKEIGEAMGFNGSNQCWQYNLPFTFNFYGIPYNSLYISTNGFVDFDGPEPDVWNGEQMRIMPFAEYLSTYYDIDGKDIYIANSGTSVTIRWAADYEVNVSLTLFNDGTIQFDYGRNNENWWPRVGIIGPSSHIDLDGREWFYGFLTGNIAADLSSISNARFYSWDGVDVSGLSAYLDTSSNDTQRFDPNPIFGSSSRFANPVSPRNMLPQFDTYNRPIANTIGYGLNNSASLGGILPDVNQMDWQLALDLQPMGKECDLPLISPLQLNSSSGVVAYWQANQQVFSDISNDTKPNNIMIPGVDIKNLYLGYLNDKLYGAVILYSDINVKTSSYEYELTFSHVPDNESVDAIKLVVTVSNGNAKGNLYRNEYGYWEEIYQPTVSASGKKISFAIPMAYLEYLPGRFISLSADGKNLQTMSQCYEENNTYISFSNTGTISGFVTCENFNGGPIFIQAYNDIYSPEESIVASSMLSAPGYYELNGIGLGWMGYVRAIMPVYKFNMFAPGAITSDAYEEVFMYLPDMFVDLDITQVPLLRNNQWEDGVVSWSFDYDGTWYAFDAIAGGKYQFDVDTIFLGISIFDRSGQEAMVEGISPTTEWICPVRGRYFVKVPPCWNSYHIKMTCQLPKFEADIYGPLGQTDGQVNFYDLSAFASEWLTICDDLNWCYGADLNGDGLVNNIDSAMLARDWFKN